MRTNRGERPGKGGEMGIETYKTIKSIINQEQAEAVFCCESESVLHLRNVLEMIDQMFLLDLIKEGEA